MSATPAPRRRRHATAAAPDRSPSIRLALVLLGAAAAALLAGCRTTSGTAGTTGASTTTRPLAGTVLVANQQSADASIITLGAGTSERVPVGEGPHETAISPDG